MGGGIGKIKFQRQALIIDNDVIIGHFATGGIFYFRHSITSKIYLTDVFSKPKQSRGLNLTCLFLALAGVFMGYIAAE
jgi:hypothetical protein